MDSTQWSDNDGDGYGDNPFGNNPDPSLNDRDIDGRLDPFDFSINEKGLPYITRTRQRLFLDALEWNDNDGDCIGDNSDPDDDNDGYTDDAEFLSVQVSSQSKPVESFEVIVPGTNIGLDGLGLDWNIGWSAVLDGSCFA